MADIRMSSVAMKLNLDQCKESSGSLFRQNQTHYSAAWCGVTTLTQGGMDSHGVRCLNKPKQVQSFTENTFFKTDPKHVGTPPALSLFSPVLHIKNRKYLKFKKKSDSILNNFQYLNLEFSSQHVGMTQQQETSCNSNTEHLMCTQSQMSSQSPVLSPLNSKGSLCLNVVDANLIYFISNFILRIIYFDLYNTNVEMAVHFISKFKSIQITSILLSLNSQRSR